MLRRIDWLAVVLVLVIAVYLVFGGAISEVLLGGTGPPGDL